MPKQASNQPYGVEGRFARKTDVEEYVRRVKEKNPNGVVVCIDTEEGTHENVNELINDKNFELKEESFEDADLLIILAKALIWEQLQKEKKYMNLG